MRVDSKNNTKLLDCVWCTVSADSLHWSLHTSESSLIQRIHHENMHRIPPLADGRGAYSMNEQDGFTHANRDQTHRHTLPPLVCGEMWMRKRELKMKRLPPPSILPPCIPLLLPPPPPCRLEPSAHVIPWLERPRIVHMPPIVTHTRHVHTLFPITYMYTARLAFLLGYIYHHTHHTLTWRRQNPPQLLQISQWASAVSGEISTLALRSRSRHIWGWSDHCFCTTDIWWTVSFGVDLHWGLKCLWGSVRPLWNI